MRPTTTSPWRSYHGLPRRGRASHHCIVAHERQAWHMGASGLTCHPRRAADGVWHPPCENRDCSPFGPPVESQLRDGAPVREGRRSVRGWPCMYSKSSVTRFDHFVAWLLALGLYRLARGAMFVLLLAGAGCLHSHKAALARVPLVAAGERPLARRLAGAGPVGTATPAQTERACGFAAPCGVLRHVMYGCADIPQAEPATLRRGNETWPGFLFKLRGLA